MTGACSGGGENSSPIIQGEIPNPSGSAGGPLGNAGSTGVHIGGGAGGGVPGGAGAPPVGEGDACVADSATADARPAVVQMVVDISGSMDRTPGGDSSQGSDSKWDITREALIDSVVGLSDTTAIGVNFYPNVRRGDGCIRNQVGVPLAELGGAPSTQRTRFESAVNSAEPRGGTPTHAAFRFGVETLAARSLDGERFILLITDGVPTYTLTCGGNGEDKVDSGPLIAEAGQVLSTQGVKTFVIGSPGSENARDDLSRIASAGGTARASCSDAGPEYCHFDMTTEQDLGAALRKALTEIAGQIASCEYDIPAPPSGQVLDPARVNLVYTSAAGAVETILRDPSSGCTEGWQYSADGRSIVLCGPTCDRVKDDRGGKVELLFGCRTEVAVPR